MRKHRHTRSIGTRSTLAFKPVIVRIHSAHEALQADRKLEPASPAGDGATMSRQPELPPVSDFSIDGILHAIEPDIQETLDQLAEIMGRSRLSLANEYGSHLPPQGEIRASNRMFLEQLLPVAEASSSNERLAGDNIIIVGEDASVIDGSATGSAAYGLLERLRAASSNRVPQAPVSSLWRESSSIPRPDVPARSISSPIESFDPAMPAATWQEQATRSRSASWALLGRGQDSHADGQAQLVSTLPIVSEMFLAAGANGSSASNPPVVSESGRNYPLYSYDESALFEDPPAEVVPTRFQAFQSQLQSLSMVTDLHSFAAWLHRESPGSRQSAEDRLRAILDR